MEGSGANIDSVEKPGSQRIYRGVWLAVPAGVAMGCGLGANAIGDMTDGGLYMWFNIGRILVLAAIAALYMRPVLGLRQLVGCRAAPIACALLGVASLVCLASPLSQWLGASAICAAVIGGSTIGLAAMWFVRIVNTLPFSLAAAASLIAIAIEAVFRAAFPALSLAAPFASAMLLSLGIAVSATVYLRSSCMRDDPPCMQIAASGSPVHAGARPMIEVALLGLVCGVAIVAGDAWTLGVSSRVLKQGLAVGIPLVGLLALVLVTRARRVSSRRRGLRPVALVFAVAVLAGLYFGGGEGAGVTAVVLCLPEIVNVAVYLRVLSNAYQDRDWSARIFAWQRGIYLLAYFLSYVVCAHWISDSAAAPSQPIAMFAMSLLLLLCLNWVFGISDELEGIAEVEASGGVAVPPPQVSPVSLEERCTAVAREGGLTRREEQVLVLACRGLSKKQIAHELQIADDTANYYLRRVYAKLDVHTRQELLLLVLEPVALR